jgi:hypothetical protein
MGPTLVGLPSMLNDNRTQLHFFNTNFEEESELIIAQVTFGKFLYQLKYSLCKTNIVYLDLIENLILFTESLMMIIRSKL